MDVTTHRLQGGVEHVPGFFMRPSLKLPSTVTSRTSVVSDVAFTIKESPVSEYDVQLNTFDLHLKDL